MNTIWFNGIWYDGHSAVLPYNDSGIVTSIGVFDSLLIRKKSLVSGKAHYERLIHDADKIMGLMPFETYATFENIALELLDRKNTDKDKLYRLRTVVTGGSVERPLAKAQSPNIFMSCAPCPEGPLPDVNAVIISNHPRVAGDSLENCKRLDYTRSYAARRKAEARGGNEAILTNTNGNIACATTSNIFIEETGKLITPPLSEGVLAGVTRQNLLSDSGAVEDIISIERFKNADKIYLTNSITGKREITLLPD